MSEKIDTIRMTGKPVLISDRDEFNNEWKRLYDIAERICTKGVNASGEKNYDMLRLQKKCAAIDRALVKRYPTVIKTDLPKTEQEWLQVMEKYGNGPILLTRHLHNNNLIIVIQDVEFQPYEVSP